MTSFIEKFAADELVFQNEGVSYKNYMGYCVLIQPGQSPAYVLDDETLMPLKYNELVMSTLSRTDHNIMGDVLS